ncbi:Vps53 family, N-terminal protein [Cardiosporidium cionae]|uniref:Vps53 family, N-terminal protein n=1 Tax=Cardiosporidium cionae TaxID=476202 RepID=A0ABQ7J6D6_9APIC|nr:Vps53 family, N-terminal protein [Cardiosporidium cionae]|eukprot:KAF8819534.1 Vps53 family, N-terminal protein [Cardiosporidium cionae]
MHVTNLELFFSASLLREPLSLSMETETSGAPSSAIHLPVGGQWEGSATKEENEEEIQLMAEEDDSVDNSAITLATQLIEALPSDNPFDAATFDPVEYINTLFPDEKSLSKIEPSILKFQRDISSLEIDVLRTVRVQATQGQKARTDLQDVQASIEELCQRMVSMKKKAAESEQLVQEICRDIKSLNFAKINLTSTLTVLKRIVMFLMALDQLRDFATNRQYKDAANLILAARELSQHFQDLLAIPKIHTMMTEKDSIFSELKLQLQEDFDSIFDADEETIGNLPDACLTIDAISLEFRREIVTKFCLKLLEVYKILFSVENEAGGLESVNRRYIWLRRSLNEFEKKYSIYFLPSWNVQCFFAEHFCHITRQHMKNKFTESHSGSYNARLSLKYADEEILGNLSNVLSTHAEKESAAIKDHIPRFQGIISECFEAYLGPWIRLEEKIFTDLLELFITEDQMIGQKDDGHMDNSEEDEDVESMPRFIYNSAFQIFNAFKACINRTTPISTRQTLFEIFQLFKNAIKQYIEILSGRFKKGVLSLKEDTSKAICCILGTAEYCDSILPQLSSAIHRDIEESYKDKVNFEGESELLWNLKANAIQFIVIGVEAALEPSWQKMIKTNWTTVQLVRESSQFVVEIDSIIRNAMPWFSDYLSVAYYRFLCDKIVQYFIPKFIGSIYSCRKIGDLGAQQLFKDASLLKDLLLELPIISIKNRSLPSGYKKFVGREIGKVLALLKALTIPDIDSTSYKILLDEHGAAEHIEDLSKILALKAHTEFPTLEGQTAPPYIHPSGTREYGREFQALGGSIKEQSLRAAEENMRSFFGLFSRTKHSGNTTVSNETN